MSDWVALDDLRPGVRLYDPVDDVTIDVEVAGICLCMIFFHYTHLGRQRLYSTRVPDSIRSVFCDHDITSTSKPRLHDQHTASGETSAGRAT